MKKPILSLFLSSLFASFAVCSATSDVDVQLVDQLYSWSKVIDADSFKFKQAKSCESLEEMLAKYAKERPVYRDYWFWLNYSNWLEKWVSIQALDVEDAVAYDEAETASLSMDSSSVDFSQTNIQKKWVDEPDKIKTDWKYFYYYNEKTDKVSIVESPLDISNSTLDPNKVKIVKEIEIPSSLNGVELFVNDNRLVIIWNYWANIWDYEYIFNENRTITAIYDISDINNLNLLKFENLPWYYRDARLIWNQLYVVTQQSLNWYVWKSSKVDLKRWLSSVEITSKGSQLNEVDCSDISYVLPEDEDLNLNPTFTIVTSINIKDTNQKDTTTALLSPTWELHMSKDSLYLVSNYYTPARWRCPVWLYCVTSVFWWKTQTMIHKFSRDWAGLKYVNTALAQWTLLTQYSMDEDSKGNFRILTSVWDNERSTSLYVFDSSLKLAWKLENIEPGESFKSSRYIWDKLYLVTFEQIDPLFVIDIADIKNPKILWELKIPWYSTYLHPLKSEGSKQYLVWLWYSTAENQWWWIINSWVKLSLFEVDYARNASWNISISELDSLTQWGQWSSSDALSNPRLFVMDKDGNITLPLELEEWVTEWENCSISYDKNWNEISRNCYPTTKLKENFIWLKKFSVSTEDWIKEVFAKNYIDNPSVRSYSWYLRDMRVWYAWDALYTFNPLFVDFIFPNDTSKLVEFK